MIKLNEFEEFYLLIFETYKNYKQQSDFQVSELFEENYMYEKIISNYDYLKLMSLNDWIEFVEEKINESKNFLITYHGSNYKFKKIDLLKSKPFRDFGKGFYCTLIKKQAKDWAITMSDRNNITDKYVYTYKLIFTSDLKVKRFKKFDKEWLDFIISHRFFNKPHDYDIVIGPMADDKITPTISKFLYGERNIDETIKKLRYRYLNNQVSIHTEKALNNLKYIAMFELDEEEE